ncbi:hypothetical protein [Macrococcus equipercicus]|nr:hypothetical protein [Macrococcus equipercicus]
MTEKDEFGEEQDTPSVSHHDDKQDTNQLEQLIDDLFDEDDQKRSD